MADLISILPQQLVFGLALGTVYGLIALGYTMVYGVLQLINFAHSEVFMYGTFAIAWTFIFLHGTDSAQAKIFRAFSGQGDVLDSRELGRIAACRIAVNTQQDGIRAVATPVFQDREVVAAMAVVGTIANLPEHEDSKLAARLRRTAEKLSGELGFLANERSTA